jgi:threonine dehydrogenase-like Zn-dependent dehydrogenase
LYRGEAPDPFDPSLGDAPVYPRRYGYAWVGRALDDSAFAEGTRVFALAPHAEWHVLERANARPIPDGIPSSRAVLSANLETAINVVWDANPSLGDRVVVLGAGVVGLLVSWLCARSGARVRVVEPSPRRRAVALELGASQASAPDEDLPRANADIVIEASGDPSLLDRAVLYAAFEARIVVASFYGARRASVSLGEEFHRRRLQLCSSQVSRIPSSHAARWTLDRRFELVLSLLADPKLDRLLDNVVPFERAAETYAALSSGKDDTLQTVFDYGFE